MFVILAHNWWTLLLRGILAVVFGVLCFVYPGLTLIVLAIMFGAYALVDGIFAVVAAVSAPSGGNRTLRRRARERLVALRRRAPR